MQIHEKVRKSPNTGFPKVWGFESRKGGARSGAKPISKSTLSKKGFGHVFEVQDGRARDLAPFQKLEKSGFQLQPPTTPKNTPIHHTSLQFQLQHTFATINGTKHTYTSTALKYSKNKALRHFITLHHKNYTTLYDPTLHYYLLRHGTPITPLQTLQKAFSFTTPNHTTQKCH